MPRVNLLGSDGKSPLALAIAGLRSHRANDRMAAARTLAALVRRGDVSAPVAEARLAPLEQDPVPAVSLAAGCAMLAIDPMGYVRKMRDRLVSMLDRAPDPAMLAAATRAFFAAADEELGRSLTAAVEAAAREGAESARVEPAALMLGEIAAHGDGTVVRTLLAILSSPTSRHRVAAAWAVGRSGRPEAFEALKLLVLSGNEAMVDKALRGVADADGPEIASRLLDALRYDARPAILERLRTTIGYSRRGRVAPEHA